MGTTTPTGRRRLRHGRAHRRSTEPTIACVVGARPNFVKMAPVIASLRADVPDARHLLVHTGQHYDRNMSAVFFAELDVPLPDYHLRVGSRHHGAQTGMALQRLEEVFLRERPDVVVVAGDVNSTLATALAAAKLHVPVAHIESGLRSFDRAMPEEVNRVVVDQLSSWCFIHSRDGARNLTAEGVAAGRIHFVGNTLIDSLVRLRGAIERSAIASAFGLMEREYLLVTLHRPAVVDDDALFRCVLEQLDELSGELPVIFPMHPRTRARLGGWRARSSSLMLAPALGYIDFLALVSRARAVLTDSGGVQEETTFLGVPCFTLRSSTERPVTVLEGTNTLLGVDPAAIRRVPSLLRAPLGRSTPPEGWDGRASQRVSSILARDILPQATRRATAGAEV